jgi:23S rRNA (adenine2030-N6)-methyltransferase
MNYRHIYHAGNRADVMKHAVLALALRTLGLKDKPYRFIDTHGGIGVYDLHDAPSRKTLEAAGGILQLWQVRHHAPPSMEPYLASVEQLNEGNTCRYYPGSPAIAKACMRESDKAIINELHPEDTHTLQLWSRGDRRIKTLRQDAWAALVSLVAPPEKRGLVLIDPPFEKTTEWADLVNAMGKALVRWQQGSYLIWYPLKTGSKEVGALASLKNLPRLPESWRMEWHWQGTDEPGLGGSGLILVNPPYPMTEPLPEMLNWLHSALGSQTGSILWERL